MAAGGYTVSPGIFSYSRRYGYTEKFYQSMKIICTLTNADIANQPEDIAYRFKDSEYLCFLDSSLVPHKYSRFSYVGWEPSFVLKSYGLANEFINISKGIRYFSYQHPLEFLRSKVNSVIFHIENNKKNNIRIYWINGRKIKPEDPANRHGRRNMPDFIGGFMGYFSYDLKDYIEELPRTVNDDQCVPLIYQVFFNKLLAYNHIENKWYFIRNYIVKDKTGKMDEVFGREDLIDPGSGSSIIAERTSGELEKIKISLTRNAVISEEEIIKKYTGRHICITRLKSNLKKYDYIRRVKRVKDYIYKGDIYQVNFSQRFEAKIDAEPADIYYMLRRKNPAPFSAYLGFPDFSVGSSSPERFLYLKDNIIETRPIKGTRPRGRNSEEDKKNALELEESLKDRAELNMIVDLERNDLGKFCYYGTVKVDEHAVIEKYERVLHSVSTVRGRVKGGTGIHQIIKATFPGGSITGAPKIRAMEIIDELETVSRGVYTGSIGYISIDNTMDLNIVIRTFIIKNGIFYYNVGGGIVADSRPVMEYRETLDKGAALRDTFDFFGGIKF
jgi:para-aminobenzoate synthetase component I